MSKNFIGGKWREAVSGGTLESVDPSTGHAYGAIADSGAEDVDLAVRAARKAFDEGRMGTHDSGRSRPDAVAPWRPDPETRRGAREASNHGTQANRRAWRMPISSRSRAISSSTAARPTSGMERRFPI